MRILLFSLLLPFLADAQVDFKVVQKNNDTLWVRTVGVEVTRSYTFTQWKIDTVTLKYKPTTTPPVVQPPSGSVVANLTFNNPNNIFEGSSLPNSRETFGNWPPKVVNSGGRTGVLQVGVNSTSKDGNRIRNEITQWNLPTLKAHATYSIDVFIPANFKTDQNSNNFIQFHNAGRSGMIPNVSFMLKGKQLDLNIAWTTRVGASHSDVHYFFDVSNWWGRWVTIYMDVNWFPDATGYFKLYFDGNPAVSTDKSFNGVRNGPMGYIDDTQGPYGKIGIHYPSGVLPAGSTENSQYVLYDNFIITK